MTTRRAVLAGGGTMLLEALTVGRPRASDAIGQALRPWRRGQLDIHHIATGRGDATLIVAPDGDVALIDAGAVARSDPAQVAARPDGSRRPGEWIARYARRRLAETGGERLSAAVVTHLHPDHIGGITDGAANETGLGEVARHVRFKRLIDPAWPHYGYPPFEDRASAEHYVAFAHRFQASGGKVEKLAVGRTGQILPDQTAFSLRAVAARGRYWDGASVREAFPQRAALAPTDYPSENAMSAAFLVTLGGFRYFIGGDLTDWADAGARPWLNVLTPVAHAIGPVDVAVLPHHGMFDAGSSPTIAALRARAWIVSAWHAAHPSIDVIERVYNERLYRGPRDVFATALHSATRLTMARLTQRFVSSEGHIVVRVSHGGGDYAIVVTDSADERDRVTSVTRYSTRLKGP